MANTYGEDWAEQRLPLCGCKDLLRKWKSRGGDVLDHADYAHYKQIMSYPEHFEAVFEVGFDDPQSLAELLMRAGGLRAASHHARTLSLKDLRVTCGRSGAQSKGSCRIHAGLRDGLAG